MSNEKSAERKRGDDRKETVVPGVVLELIEQSETIQGWMEQLPEHADDAYPQVLERVSEDYRGRLETVAAKLAEHQPDLISNLGAHQGRVVSLRDDRESHDADREEARVRHAVGEFSEGEWGSRRKKIEGLLAQVDARLKKEEGAVEEITTALERIDAGGAPKSEGAVVFGSDGFVEVKHGMPGSGDTGSWAKVLSVAPDENESEAAPVAPPATEARTARPVKRAKNGSAADNGSGTPDELDFLEAVTQDSIEKLDSITVATRNGK